MNILIDQFRTIADAHNGSGLSVNLNFSPCCNAWFVSADIGNCEFILASQRKPVRYFKSIDTASFYIMEQIGIKSFMVNWAK